jgi:hypothetical protein
MAQPKVLLWLRVYKPNNDKIFSLRLEISFAPSQEKRLVEVPMAESVPFHPRFKKDSESFFRFTLPYKACDEEKKLPVGKEDDDLMTMAKKGHVGLLRLKPGVAVPLSGVISISSSVEVWRTKASTWEQDPQDHKAWTNHNSSCGRKPGSCQPKSASVLLSSLSPFRSNRNFTASAFLPRHYCSYSSFSSTTATMMRSVFLSATRTNTSGSRRRLPHMFEPTCSDRSTASLASFFPRPNRPLLVDDNGRSLGTIRRPTNSLVPPAHLWVRFRFGSRR